MKNVLFYGDSNTWGYQGDDPMHRLDADKRYTGVVAAQFPDVHFIEEGLCGRTICSTDPIDYGRNGMAMLPALLATHDPLDVIVIMLGTNDSKAMYGHSPFTISDAMDRTIKLMQSPLLWSNTMQKPQILLVAPPKMGENLADSVYYGMFDESSAALIQGITLAGILLDEVALMPESFVNQATARCSVEGAKLWFNCNPEGPSHWFYTKWVLEASKRKMLHLHFTMDDNLSLSASVKARYESLYSGVFYDRFIRGLWVVAEGLIYTMFNKDFHVVPSVPRPYEKYVMSCDYGTINPTSIGLWGKAGGKWYRMREYYYDSRKEGRQRTDEEHYTELERLADGLHVSAIIVDPSAASFIEVIRRHDRYRVEKASNSVLDGIRNVATRLQSGDIFFCDCCTDCIREFGMYRWDEKAQMDRPIKENDHSMDDVRYFVHRVYAPDLISFK